MILLLRGKLDKHLVMMAMCCSSWVAASRGSTGRSTLTPMGRTEFTKVAVANLLGSRPMVLKPYSKSHTLIECPCSNSRNCFLFNAPARLALAIMLAVSAGATFLVEQPASSLLMHHERLRALWENWYGRINVLCS